MKKLLVFRGLIVFEIVLAVPVILQSSEFMIDTNIVPVPACQGQYLPSIAFDGTNYLVVWGDTRGYLGYPEIYGVRVNTSGHILDIISIAITNTTSSEERSPVVAFDGVNYLVVWSNDYRIRGARVSPSGTVIDSNSIHISPSHPFGNQYEPCVAFDGTNYLVVWSDGFSADTTSDIYGAIVSPSGTVGAYMPICTAPGAQDYPSVTFAYGNYLVVWRDLRMGWWPPYIYGTRVTPSGAVLDTGILISSLDSCSRSDPFVAFGDTNYFVVWSEYRSSWDIYGARVSESGTLLDTMSIVITETSHHEETPSLAFDGIHYFITWRDTVSGISDIYGARVSQDGIVDTVITISTANNNQRNPSLVFNGINYFVVWEDFRYNYNFYSPDICGTRVNSSSTVLDTAGILVSTEANNQRTPSLAFDGVNYFAVWHDNREGRYFNHIYGMRISPLGTVLDSTSITISTSNYNYNQQDLPDIAFDGNNYFVVWADYGMAYGTYEIYGARVTPQGVVIDTAGINISTANGVDYLPSVAFDGVNYLVVWIHEGGFVSGARVSPSGTVIDTAEIRIGGPIGSNYPTYPDVAFNGMNYLVVWQLGDFFSTAADIYGARVSPSGVVLDTIPIVTQFYGQTLPAVASDGMNYLVAWNDKRVYGQDKIYCARIDSSGTVLDSGGIPLVSTISIDRFLSLSFDNTSYFLVWNDGYMYNTNIYGAHISLSGVLVDSFAISTQGGEQDNPVIAKGPGAQSFIAWERRTYRPTGVRKATRIWGKFYPGSGMEEQAIRDVSLIEFEQPRPNPFLQEIEMRYSLPQPTEVNLSIYNVAGVKVTTLIEGKQTAGLHIIKWDSKDASGKKVPQGVYFCVLNAEKAKKVHKLIVMK